MQVFRLPPASAGTTPAPAPASNRSIRNLKTFSQFARDNPAFTEGGLRWLKFCSAPGRKDSRGADIPVNGFAPAFISVGRRVYLDEDRFFAILDAKGGEAAP